MENIAKFLFLNEFNENQKSKPITGNQIVNQISKTIAAAVFAVTTPTKHPANIIEKNQNGDFPFHGTTTPINNTFITFDFLVGFIDSISINVIITGTINHDRKKNRQKL